MADPITFVGSLTIGLTSRKIKTAIIFSSLLGAVTSIINYFLARQLNLDYSLVDSGLGQFASCVALSLILFSLKMGYKRLKRIQDDMDDCQAFFIDPDTPSNSHEATNPIFTDEHKARFKKSADFQASGCSAAHSLNRTQKMILGTMFPVLTLIGLRTIAIVLYDTPHTLRESWWLWISGLSLLTWFEVWFWRD